MSGWIKLEKDLATDPRVIRIGKALDRKFAFFTPERAERDGTYDPSNATPLPGVTLAVGALALLWIYADSHARDDDSLDLGVGEIDELLGIPGFCSLMPSDWLTVIDEHTVELPGFQSHNGVEAKNKDLNAKRQARHREKVKRTAVTGRNAPPLPDQDQTRPRPRPEIHTERERADSANSREGNGEPPGQQSAGVSSALTRARTFGDGGLMDGFAAVVAVYPKRLEPPGLLDEREYQHRLDEGIPHDELEAGAQRYAAFVKAGGVGAPMYVKAIKTFFAKSNRYWQHAWDPPATKGQQQQDENIAASQEWLARSSGNA